MHTHKRALALINSRASRSLLRQVYVELCWRLCWVKLAQVGSMLAPSWLKLVHVGSMLAQVGLMLAQVGSNWLQVASILPQVGLKLG